MIPQIDFNADKISYNSGKISTDLFGKYAGDTDKDGLKDWEEILWKTDAKNPDSDGDGMSDGDEVAEGRDPTVAGPDDRLSSRAGLAEIPFGPIGDENLTFSDTVAREFFINYLALKDPSGGNITQQQKDVLVDSFLGSLASEATENGYKISDLKITSDNTRDGMKRYGNEIAKIVNSYAVEENELLILDRALERGDSEEIKKLSEIAGIYISASKDMLEVETPAVFQSDHLVLVNSFLNIGRAVSKMQKVFDDPLVSIVGLGNYKEGIKNINNTFKNLQNSFLENNISFSEDDPGQFFISVNFTYINE